MEWYPEEPGGLNRGYYEFVRRLPACGVAVRGIVLGSDAVARDSGGAIRGVAPVNAPLPLRLFRIWREATARLAEAPDSVVVGHFALYTAPLLGLLRAPGRIFVVHFHGPWAQETSAEGARGVVPWLKGLLERAVYRRADACIVLSRAFGQILHDSFDVPWERIHVIPGGGGVDCARFDIAESRDACRDRLKWPRDRRIVLAVRRLTNRMGLQQLVAAVSQLRERVPDILVLIAGRGPIEQELRALIARAQLDAHCQLVGFVAEDDLPAAYRAADLTIVPSVALEGYGLIVPESLAAGTPVLVTPVGGLPETVEGLSPNLVLADSSTDAIAKGIGDALTGAMAMPSAETCRAYAKRRNDWPVVVEEVRQVYAAARRA